MSGPVSRRPRVRMSECRDCSFPIVFARITKTGRRMPLDPLPEPAGNVVCRLIGGALHGRVLGKGERMTYDDRAQQAELYMPHAATCEAKKPRVPRQRGDDHDALF